MQWEDISKSLHQQRDFTSWESSFFKAIPWWIFSNSLAKLLRMLNEALMKAYVEHNKIKLSTISSEDEKWGGNGGGQGQNGQHDRRA
ncbi:hypothetical protein Tco_0814492 [Tanacetum coccineum]